MEAIIATVNRKYNLTHSDVYSGDPRVEKWFLMNSFGSVLAIDILYLLMVKHGPAFMKMRAPFSLSSWIVIYNFALVILSAYMLFEFLSCGIIRSYNLFCQPVNYDHTEIGLREASAAWWYFFSKVIELLDTFFFIIRKKNSQVTFLHVFHHSSMMVICWYVAKYVPGGEKFYSGGLNCLVHIFMYTYYGLAAMGPEMQKYLWWKRYITELQLTQFMVVNIRIIISFFHGPCEYPRWINVFALFYSSTLLILFLNFYLKSYKNQTVHTVRSKESLQKVE